MFSKGLFLTVVETEIVCEPFPKQQVLDSSKVEELADDNFTFHENGSKFSKQIENMVGKGEIAHY